MQDFLKQAASQFGISEKQAGNATGGILNILKEHSGGSKFQDLMGKLPGAEGLMKQATGGGSGGDSGGIMGAVGGLLGGKAGNALSLAGILQGTGLKMDDMGSFVGKLVDYMKGKAGGDLVDKLIGKAPELSGLLKVLK
ncbi:MAG: DUF2780 domain-containing protein [Phycisphaerales bacterium]|nr:DUF2780 domain-containing protein [Phycisphaerales bacterium]